MEPIKIITALVLSISPFVAFAEPPSNEELLKRIQDLEQEVKSLRRELKDEATAEKAKTQPTVSIGAAGLRIQSADTNFVMRLGGHLQMDGRFFPSSGSAVDDTFLVRKARPIIEGTLYDQLDYRLMLDFGSGLNATAANVGFLQEAYINYRWKPELQLQAGKFKEPVGLERLQRDVDYLFIERAYPSQIVPNRDVGVQLQGKIGDGLFSYAAGVFNGVEDGGSGDVETTDDDKDIAGRIFTEPLKQTQITALKGLGFGVGGTFGHHVGPLRGYTSAGQQNIFSYYSGNGTNALTSATGDIWRISPQLTYYYGAFGLLGEYALSNSEVTRTGGGVGPVSKNIERSAWQLAASYFLTGEENGFQNPVPLKPFTFHADGWGAWEVVARVSELKLDPNTFPLFADPKINVSRAFSYGTGVNWHLNRNFKLSLDYEHSDFKGGSGTPTDENAILTRGQLTF